jgi:3-phenylpropionate/cinnamic acid dioxygenase small subunit
MEPVLRELIDRQEITALLVRYGTSLDDRDWDRLRTCFTPDATGDYDPRAPNFEGYAAIETLCRTMLEPLDASQHLIGNFELEIHGDTAMSRCYVRAQHVKQSCQGGPLFEVAGSYHDELTRSDDGWRIHKRKMVVAWHDGNPRVLQPDPARDET